MELDDLRARVRRFAAERDWEQFHTPRNLALALVGEVGELAELLQWRTDAEILGDAPNSESHTQLAWELADVLIYLVRLADVLEVELDSAVLAKLESNAARYPAEEVRGDATKRPPTRGTRRQAGG